MYKAIKIIVIGRVQGVGFRPFIFSLAKKYNIKGTVQNNMDGVFIIAESNSSNLETMISEIKTNSPRLARVDEIIVENIEKATYKNFMIIPSERTGKSSLIIPVDSAVCDDCIAEMNDKNNFRYLYPFINCTQCGPRYTIIDQLPYDRHYTTMNQFNMCDKCSNEYNDPHNRRHHAQPIACSLCGPEVKLLDINNTELAKANHAIELTKKFLINGFIIAIKGIGGYHLACDAYNEEAILKLRDRKNRPSRPLAVMARSMDLVERLCYVSDEEKDILLSPEAPIVVLKKRKENGLPISIAPKMNTLGVMLPYAPIHHLLFEKENLNLLIMTSANPSGLPILYKDEQAISYLQKISDYILTSNRDILHPLDDSVLQVYNNNISFFRRSRGFVPDPIKTNKKVHEIVALGGQQNNVFAIGRHQQIFLGPHIGNMETIEVVNFFNSEYSHLMKWMGLESKLIVIDKHPQYATRKLALEMRAEILEVQHHHAHLVSCMEDNSLSKPCYGIILDGTGYGEDGNIWGFEILYGDAKFYKRMSHLKYTPLPGGDKAVKEPWRNAVGMLIEYFKDDGKILANKLFSDKCYEIDIIESMILKKINTPLAGTCGRLFDAVSAILGICTKSNYDGEPAILLSEMMYESNKIVTPYLYSIDKNEDIFEINFSQTILEIINDYLAEKNIYDIVNAFHQTIISACSEAIYLISNNNLDFNKDVVLSGGSFLNKYLTLGIIENLERKGFNVFTHKQVPSGDGGLSFGQIIIAASRY